MNMTLALLGSFVCVWVGDGGRTAWMLVCAASGAFTLSFGQFLLLMKREYRRTFWNTRTGKQWTMDFFLKDKDDKIRKNTIMHNNKQWRAIRGEVKEWVREGWWRWEADRREWFTESWIAKVSPDMIPSEAKQAAQDIRACAQRRSSLGALVVAKEEDTRAVQPVS